jgi:hypothetical protein
VRIVCLAVLAACAGSTARTQRGSEGLNELEPPVATFRWALAPLSCETDKRSTVDTCQARDALTDEHLVAVYAPLSDADDTIAVIRYDGQHAGGPLRWQRTIDIGPAPHSAVVTIVRDAVIVAAISNGSARVVAIDGVTGRSLGKAIVVERGARAVQLEGIHDFARIHVRTTSGGTVAVMHPRNGRVLAKRDVEERAIFEPAMAELPPVHEAELDGITVGWENQRLVARRGTAWMRYLRAASTESEIPRYRTLLSRAGERVIVTVHDTEDSKVEAIAFDFTRGDELWRSTITNTANAGIDNMSVRTEIERDQLLVRGQGVLERFVCSIGLADGIERACIDQTLPGLANGHVFEFGDDTIVTP